MFILWRTYSNSTKTILSLGKCNAKGLNHETFTRLLCNGNDSETPELINGTIMLENGLNVTELPVVIRKLKDLTELEGSAEVPPKINNDTISYKLIQEEFKQCMDLRDVFSLITKCTKITPNIALGAIERIYDLEKTQLTQTLDSKNDHHNIYVAKGAILDKLLKVVIKTEDTKTIINILKTNSSVIEPYKYKFCDELLLRVTDNKLCINQLCEFATFLSRNIEQQYYCDLLDKLWVGFTVNEANINETNIVKIFSILSGLKVSKKMMINLLEQKLADLWPKIKSVTMQDIMTVFTSEKYFSTNSYAVLGNWFFAHIHALDEDTMSDIITKFTRFNYTDEQTEAAIEKYMRLKGSKIKSYVLVVCILNYCMQFRLQNKKILEVCCDYYVNNIIKIPPSFIKSFIYPFGYLYYKPTNDKVWDLTEKILLEYYKKINVEDLSSIILSYIYVCKYPVTLVSKVFHLEYFTKVSNTNLLRKLYLIDTAMTIECEGYSGPLLPKDQWLKPAVQNQRIRNLINKIKHVIVSIFGESRVSTAVLVPNYCSDENFLIDIMLHPVGLGSDTFNWKLKSNKNENIAILIHLPDDYCTKSEQLVGSQIMKKRHLELLGFKVVSLKYSVISQLYLTYKTSELKTYLLDNIGIKNQH